MHYPFPRVSQATLLASLTLAAALNNNTTATVAYEHTCTSRGIRNLLLEGFGADGKVLTSVSWRLQVF